MVTFARVAFGQKTVEWCFYRRGEAMDAHQALLHAKILVVDDDAAIVMILEDLLSAAGFTTVRSTTDARQVFRLYQEWQPDLILLDIHMAYLDGFEVMAQLKPVEQDYLPILVLTGDTMPEVRQRALEVGAKDFLHKPFDPIEALTRIRNMLEVRLLRNALREHNAWLEAKVRERTQELQETRLEIIRRLGRAVEYRDNATGLHVIRMSYYAASLARAAGMSAEECELLFHASPMHDIGKIGIPDRILLKPGRLDADEWAVMRTHTTIGAEMLSGHASELMQMAYLTALTHHEKWDGTGYPQGLQGEAIPLVGRITAISDVFDALTSTRPYKHAWSVEDAVAEIDRRRGTHFDPHLVERFCELLPELLKIKQQYDEP
jgi:putative two-component system response regulator